MLRVIFTCGMSKGQFYELAVVSFVYNRDGAYREFRDGVADQEDIVLSNVNSTTLLDESSRFYRILGVMTVPPSVPPTVGGTEGGTVVHLIQHV